MEFLKIYGTNIINEATDTINNQVVVDYALGNVFQAINNDSTNDFILNNKKSLVELYLISKSYYLLAIINSNKLDSLNKELESNTSITTHSLEFQKLIDILNDELKFISQKYKELNPNISAKYADDISQLFEAAYSFGKFISNDKIFKQSNDPNQGGTISNYDRSMTKLKSEFNLLYSNIKDKSIELIKKVVNDEVKDQDDYENKIDTIASINSSSFPKLGLDVKNATEELKTKAEEANLNVEQAINIKIKTIISKIKAFEQFQAKTNDEIITKAYYLNKLLERYKTYITEDGYNRFSQLIIEIAATKHAILTKAEELDKLKSEQKSKEPETNGVSMSKIIESDSFEYNIPIRLPLGKTVTLKTSDLKGHNKVTSWISKLAKASNEVFGYEAQGYITSVVDKYQGFRDLNATTIEKGLKTMGKVAWLIGKKKEGERAGERIGDWLREELMLNPGQANSLIVDLEEDLINTDIVIANTFRKKENKKHYRSTIIDKPTPLKRKEESEIGREKSKIKRGLTISDSIIFDSFTEDNKINEDFGPMGSVGDVGGGNISGPVSPNVSNVGNGFYNTPGMISNMGDIHAPTPDQTPFKNGEKTSIKDSGSGDKFTSDKKKKKDEEEIEKQQKEINSIIHLSENYIQSEFKMFIKPFNDFK